MAAVERIREVRECANAYGPSSRRTASDSTTRPPGPVISAPGSASGDQVNPWHSRQASNGPGYRRWACAWRAMTVPVPKTTTTGQPTRPSS